MSKARINPPVSPGLTLKCTTPTMAYAAAADAWRPVKDCEIPPAWNHWQIGRQSQWSFGRLRDWADCPGRTAMTESLRSPWLML